MPSRTWKNQSFQKEKWTNFFLYWTRFVWYLSTSYPVCVHVVVVLVTPCFVVCCVFWCGIVCGSVVAGLWQCCVCDVAGWWQCCVCDVAVWCYWCGRVVFLMWQSYVGGVAEDVAELCWEGGRARFETAKHIMVESPPKYKYVIPLLLPSSQLGLPWRALVSQGNRNKHEQTFKV